MHLCCDVHFLPVQPSGLVDKETTLGFLLNPCSEYFYYLKSSIFRIIFYNNHLKIRILFSTDKRHLSKPSSAFRAGTMWHLQTGIETKIIFNYVWPFMIMGYLHVKGALSWRGILRKEAQVLQDVYSSKLKLQKLIGKKRTFYIMYLKFDIPKGRKSNLTIYL